MLAAARAGDYRSALEMAGDVSTRVRLYDDLYDELTVAPLVEACELAELIDTFLAVLERQVPTPLVAGCRDDLDTLPILADWCEENGLPMAGREARHLHGLVRSSR